MRVWVGRKASPPQHHMLRSNSCASSSTVTSQSPPNCVDSADSTVAASQLPHSLKGEPLHHEAAIHCFHGRLTNIQIGDVVMQESEIGWPPYLGAAKKEPCCHPMWLFPSPG